MNSVNSKPDFAPTQPEERSGEEPGLRPWEEPLEPEPYRKKQPEVSDFPPDVQSSDPQDEPPLPLWDEMDSFKEDFESKNPEEQRDILLKIGEKINQAVTSIEKDKISRTVHDLSENEIKNIDQRVLDNKNLLSNYLAYGTNDKKAIKEHNDYLARHETIHGSIWKDEDKNANGGSSIELPSKENLDLFFKIKPDYLTTDNITEKLTSDYIIKRLNSLSEHGININRVIDDFDRETLEDLPESRIHQLEEMKIDKYVLDKIKNAKQEKNEKQIEEKLKNNSLTAEEIADNYDFLKSRGFSISPKELLNKYRDEQEEHRWREDLEYLNYLRDQRDQNPQG